LIRDGISNRETYTLEVCLGVNCIVQKISLKDIDACRNYAKQLSKSGYHVFSKGKFCDWGTRTKINQLSLSKQVSERTPDKRRKEDKDKKKRIIEA